MAAEGEGQSTDGQALILLSFRKLTKSSRLIIGRLFYFHKNKTIILKFRKHFFVLLTAKYKGLDSGLIS